MIITGRNLKHGSGPTVSEVKKCSGVHRASAIFQGEKIVNERKKRIPVLLTGKGAFCKGISDP